MEELQPRRGRPPKYVEVSPVETEAPQRKSTRKPFGRMQQKLAYPDRPGFHRHWFNDIPGRIVRAQEAGYDHVKDDEGKNVSRIVGTAESGGPLHAFLMEIPEEWWKEDLAAEQAEVDRKEQSMKRGTPQGDANPKDFYVPGQGIKIERK